MIREKIIKEVKSIESEIIENRRYLHSHAVVGFELKESYFNEAVKNVKSAEFSMSQKTLFDLNVS